MKTLNRTSLGLLAVGAAGVLALSACGGSSSGSSSSNGDSSSMSSSSMAMDTSSSMSSSMGSDSAMAGGPVGPACADYAKMVPSGSGSVSGMAQDPVATAASNNPLLTTLTSAVSGKLNPDVNLVDTLNGGQFTVFAPTDDAFKKIDPATIDKLKTDKDLLTKILTYHVVQGQIDPSNLDGDHKTVEGDTLSVSGDPSNLTVNGKSMVVCGGVKTANATVYMVDTVLMPPNM